MTRCIGYEVLVNGSRLMFVAVNRNRNKALAYQSAINSACEVLKTYPNAEIKVEAVRKTYGGET